MGNILEVSFCNKSITWFSRYLKVLGIKCKICNKAMFCITNTLRMMHLETNVQKANS